MEDLQLLRTASLWQLSAAYYDIILLFSIILTLKVMGELTCVIELMKVSSIISNTKTSLLHM